MIGWVCGPQRTTPPLHAQQKRRALCLCISARGHDWRHWHAWAHGSAQTCDGSRGNRLRLRAAAYRQSGRNTDIPAPRLADIGADLPHRHCARCCSRHNRRGRSAAAVDSLACRATHKTRLWAAAPHAECRLGLTRGRCRNHGRACDRCDGRRRAATVNGLAGAAAYEARLRTRAANAEISQFLKRRRGRDWCWCDHGDRRGLRRRGRLGHNTRRPRRGCLCCRGLNHARRRCYRRDCFNRLTNGRRRRRRCRDNGRGFFNGRRCRRGKRRLEIAELVAASVNARHPVDHAANARTNKRTAIAVHILITRESRRRVFRR